MDLLYTLNLSNNVDMSMANFLMHLNEEMQAIDTLQFGFGLYVVIMVSIIFQYTIQRAETFWHHAHITGCSHSCWQHGRVHISQLCDFSVSVFWLSFQ